MNAPLSIVWRDRPFDGKVHQHLVPLRGKSPTIAEALSQVPGLPRAFLDVGEVRLNGQTVPRDWWMRVRPRPDRNSAITLHMPIRNRGGGGQQSGGRSKSTLATVASIGVLLAATAVSGGAAAPLLGGFVGASTLAAGSLGATALAATVGIGGALLVASLFPPPTTAVSSNQQVAQPLQDGPASIQGNVVSPGSAVPRVVGTMRLFPPFLSPQLVELRSGGVEYAETVLGLAGPHALSNIWVDGVDITSIPEATVEIQEGLNRAGVQGLVQRQGYTVEPNLTLSQHQTDPSISGSNLFLDPSKPVSLAVPQWHKFVTRNAPDELWMHFDFASGLVNNGNSSTGVPFRIQIRQSGSSSWISLPELHYQVKGGSQAVSKKTEIRLKWLKSPGVQTVTGNYNGGTGWIYAFSSVPGQVPTPTTAGWTADSHFYSGSGNTYLSAASLPGTSGVINVDLTGDNAVIYLDPAVFTPGYYEIQVIRGVAYAQSNFAQSNYNYNNGGVTNVWDFFDYWYSSGSNKNAIASDQISFSSQCNVLRIASVWNQNPIQAADFATISMVVYNRQLSNISVLASGYVADWDGTGWNNITTTSNPAPHLRDVLGGSLGALPIPATIIDDAGIVDWRTSCNSLGYTVNAVLEGKTVIDALTLLASCGYARPSSSETWGVIKDFDRSAEVPIQIFTPRNMSKFNWTKAFPRQPTGFRISYLNILLNYNKDDTTYFTDPVNQDANNLESMTYDGLVAIADINKRAKYDLQQAISRMTFYSGESDIESIVCKRGDLIGVQYDTLSSAAGFARIASVQESGGMITGLTFEGTVPINTQGTVFAAGNLFDSPNIFDVGGRTGCAIRLKGGNGLLTKEITAAVNGEQTVVTFPVPFADPGVFQLEADCLCAIGPLGSEYRRLIVYGVVPKDDLTATITMVDEAPELWT